MSHDPNGRIDRDTAERLLRGEPAGPAGLASLLAVLSEAAAPVPSGPLPGEREALAAFQRATATPVRRPRRRMMIKLALAQMLATKAFAATAAAAAVGGVAVAAVTGTIPVPGHRDDVVTAGPTVPGEPTHDGAGDGGTEHPKPTDPAKPTEHPSGNPSEHPSGNPSRPPEPAPGPAAFPGLCRALFSGHGGEVADKLARPEYAGLLAQGGGTKDGVVAFCISLIGPPVHHTEPPKPEPSHTESHEPTPEPTHTESHSPEPTHSEPPSGAPATEPTQVEPSSSPTQH